MRNGCAVAAGLVAALLLVVLVACCAGGARDPRALAPPSVPLALSRTVWRGGGRKTLVVPVVYDSGVYTATLLLGGDQPVRVVLDTASDRLVVAGSTCSTCEASHGAYSPARSLTYRALAAVPHQLVYGTQEDRAILSEDEVTFVGCYADQFAGGACDYDRRIAAGTDAMSVPRAPFSLVERRNGESNYNIMGLLYSPDATRRGVGGDEYAPFLEDVMPSNVQFTISLHPLGGWMALGDPSHLRGRAYAPPLYFPLLKRPQAELPGLPFAFYLSRVEGMTVGGVALGHAPDFALWDTGSNMLGCSPALLAELEQRGVAGDAATAPVVSLALRQTNGKMATLDLPPSLYQWDDGTLLIEDESPFRNAEVNRRVIVMGSLLMQHFVLEFYPQRYTLGIGLSRRPQSAAAGCSLAQE